MRIEVNQLPPIECSPNWTGHWSKLYKASEVYRGAVYLECVNVRNLLSQKAFRKPRLDLTFVFPRPNVRDEDNMRARFKPGQDAIVLAGLIEDDNPGHLIIGDLHMEVDKARAPLTIIELEESDE